MGAGRLRLSTPKPWPASSARSRKWWRWAQVGIVVGGGNLFRGATGALSGMDRATADHGHAGHGDECPGPEGCLVAAGIEARVQTAVTIAHVGEAVRAGQRGAASGSRPRGDLRRRHRQPVLHHRYRLRPARRGNRRRPDAQGHQGGWRLHRRPQEGPDGHPLRTPDFRRSHRPEPGRAGYRRLSLCAGSRSCPGRVQHLQAGALKRVVMGEPEGTRVVRKLCKIRRHR
jgi:uridylate kinase